MRKDSTQINNTYDKVLLMFLSKEKYADTKGIMRSRWSKKTNERKLIMIYSSSTESGGVIVVSHDLSLFGLCNSWSPQFSRKSLKIPKGGNQNP